jgi:TIR domain
MEMRLRFPILVGCAVTSSLAVAGGVTESEPSFSLSGLLSSIPLGPLLTVVVVFGVLFKVYSRWPELERWLVGASLLMLPPAATYLIGWWFYTGSSSPVRDTGIFWAVTSLLLAIAWWVLKFKTTILSAPAAQPKPVQPVKTELPPAMMRSEDVPPRAPPPSPAPEPKPARAAAHGNDAIFISYRRQDSADATGRIYDRLTQHFGREQVFKDVDSIPLGVDFREHLGNVVGRCNFLIAVIGPQWSTATGPNGRRLDDKSDFVRVEIEAALARNIPVIPVLIGGAALPADTELPPSIGAITYRNGISVRPDPDFHRDMDRLIAGLEQHGSR